MIEKLCISVGQRERLADCLKEKETAISNSVSRGNPEDDLKSARGEIYTALKAVLGLTKCGNNADSFVRDTLAPLISPDMNVYQQLEAEIFGS